MKKIFGYYGRAIVAVVIAMGVFAILFGVSFENRQNLQAMLGTIIGEQLDHHSRQQRMGDSFDIVANHVLPVISVTNVDSLVKGKQIPLTQFLMARDKDGKSIRVRLHGVWNEALQTQTSVQLIANTHLVFASAGIYWLQVSATDAGGFQRESMVKIYVKEG